MIWSFVKIAIFLALAAALAFGATYIMDTGGEVRLAFGGRELSLSPLMFTVIIIAAFIAMLIILKVVGLLIAVLKFVNGDETAVSRYFDRNREQKGFEALSDSMIALAAGDGKTAMSKATRAERYLERPELTQLVNAQAAEISGNTNRAEEHFKELLKNEKTRFVGVQGLMKQKLAEGDTDTAMALAKKAFAINPSHSDTIETLFQLQTDKSDWAGARETLQAHVRKRMLPKDVGNRRDAVLSYAHATQALEDDNDEAAFNSAVQANKVAPGLVPAAITLAKLYMDRNEKRKAGKVIEKAWGQSPHPDLAAAFAGLYEDETAIDRITRFKRLLKAHPDHPETRMLSAELQLAAENFPAARKAIGDLAEKEPTARALAILAAVERGSGADEAVVTGWLAKAVSASRGNAWLCDKCGHMHAEWAPVCDNCSGFDTIGWSEAPQTEDSKTMAAAMLPLIIGSQISNDESVDDAGEIIEGDISDPMPADAKAEAAEEKAL